MYVCHRCLRTYSPLSRDNFFLSLFLFIYFYIKWVINYNNVPERISHGRPQRVAKRSTADEGDKIPDDVFIICIRTDIIIYSIII